MLLYKISRYEDGPAIYRQYDDSLLDAVERWMDVQEPGNSLFIEVVDVDEWQDDPDF